MPNGRTVRYSSNTIVPMTITRPPNTVASLSNRVVSNARPALHRMKHRPVLYLIATEPGDISRNVTQCVYQAKRTANPKSATTAVARRISVTDCNVAAERLVGDWSGNSVISHNEEQANRNFDVAYATDARPAASLTAQTHGRCAVLRQTQNQWEN